MSRRRNSDAYVRALERQVLAGDLTAVRALARVYERIESGLPVVDPGVVRVLELASRELLAEYTANDNTPEWNVGGHGYRARRLVEIALRSARGESFDMAAAITEAMREAEPPPFCAQCGRDMGPEEVGDELPDERVCDQCAEGTADERRVRASAASVAAGRSTGHWAHRSGAPSCPATCPRCGHAGNLHHEAGAHYCAECDAHTAGERLEGCPGIEPEMCNCGHLESVHRGQNGHCLGIGADLDPAYGRPLDEACLCTDFEVA